jgi:hypothetical protein
MRPFHFFFLIQQFHLSIEKSLPIADSPVSQRRNLRGNYLIDCVHT